MLAIENVRERILLAGLEAATLHGIRGLSMADVARRADLSRQTVYRHFPSKEMLVTELVRAQTIEVVEKVVYATAEVDDPRKALETAMRETLRLTREHPLLDRLMRAEPESLLPLITSDGGPVVSLVRSVVSEIVEQKMPELPALGSRRLSDVVTRLLISYALNAPDDPPETVAEFVAGFLAEGALATIPTHETVRAGTS
ncbi:MAG: TetR family transcriptional regulator [Acidimicrobiales bacterium]